jgi:hypothetical protein
MELKLKIVEHENEMKMSKQTFENEIENKM